MFTMKSALALPLLWLLAGTGFAASAQPSGPVRVGNEPRNELRGAIEAHLATRREEVRSEQAFAGRRLAAEERAELREQLRRQWASHGETARTAQSQQAERIVPGSALAPTRRH